MAFTVARFNLVDPDATPETLAARYRAALEMAAYADDRGIDSIQTEEHHGATNNWLPSPSSSPARSSAPPAVSRSPSPRSSARSTIRCGWPRTSPYSI